MCREGVINPGAWNCAEPLGALCYNTSSSKNFKGWIILSVMIKVQLYPKRKYYVKQDIRVYQLRNHSVSVHWLQVWRSIIMFLSVVFNFSICHSSVTLKGNGSKRQVSSKQSPVQNNKSYTFYHFCFKYFVMMNTEINTRYFHFWWKLILWLR